MTLRQLREGAGLTLETVGARSGISKQAICNIEAGRVPNPRYSTVLGLAAALGVTPEKAHRAVQRSVIAYRRQNAA